jgi:hypothetical protein
MAQELMTDKKPAFSGWPMLIFWWAMILFALHSATHMVGAGDTWVAMACGRHFLNHGVNTVEPFSANSHKPGPTVAEVKTWPKWAQWVTDKVGLDTVKYWHPTGWVDQNWLTHVFFYWVTHLSPIADAETFDKPIVGQNITYNSLVYWKYALYTVTIIVVYYTCKGLGINPALSAVFSCFALFVGRTFFDIRPAGFTNMLVAVLIFIFVLTAYKNYLYIWLIVPITVLWCNLHGGYVYVFVVLVPFIGLHLLTLLPKRISLCLYYVLGWLFLYALSVKFYSNEYLTHIMPLSDGLLLFILIVIAASIALTALKNIKPSLFHGYHIIAGLFIFIAVVSRFFPDGIEQIIKQYPPLREHVDDSRQTFFTVFAGFAVIAVVLSVFKHRLKAITYKAWWHTVAATIIAFLAMVLFNPFHLTNLTHTFIISVSENAKVWKSVNEWHPAFEWNNPVGNGIPFLYMYILAWVLLTFWVICLLFKPRIIVKKGKAQQAELPDSQQYVWPLIDLPLLVIAAFTVDMAIGSRRFIPIAAIAACPVMAMFLDSGIRMIVSRINLKKTGRAVVSSMPKWEQYCFAGIVFVVVAFLTIWWGYWYKVIYLNPWPDSDYLTSVFMRMSASYAKPFKACQFVRDNKLKGTVYNYWTEGGFIAYGQFPDPNTGKTPLQLYMDGRAQAAYSTDTYHHWMYIMAGGEPARQVERTGRAYTMSDYKAIGEWLDKQFEKENVWVVIMPSGEFNSELIRGLETNSNWRIALLNDSQEIYINIKSQQGRDLYLGMFSGQTKFPDKFSQLLTIGHNLLYLQDEEKSKNGCELLIEAMFEFPCQVAAVELVNAANHTSQNRDRVTEAFDKYFDDFVAKRQTFIKQDGYREKLSAAMLIGDYLTKVNGGNPAIANKYKQHLDEFESDQSLINSYSRW